jgi:hypothetical protein
MRIELSFHDFVRLAVDQMLDKDGVTITYGRPVLAEIKIEGSDPPKSGKVVFYLDDTDPAVIESRKT